MIFLVKSTFVNNYFRRIFKVMEWGGEAKIKGRNNKRGKGVIERNS